MLKREININNHIELAERCVMSSNCRNVRTTIKFYVVKLEYLIYLSNILLNIDEKIKRSFETIGFHQNLSGTFIKLTVVQALNTAFMSSIVLLL